KESRMKFASATNINRKSGVAKRRDLRFRGPFLETPNTRSFLAYLAFLAIFFPHGGAGRGLISLFSHKVHSFFAMTARAFLLGRNNPARAMSPGQNNPAMIHFAPGFCFRRLLHFQKQATTQKTKGLRRFSRKRGMATGAPQVTNRRHKPMISEGFSILEHSRQPSEEQVK
ncbi:MAG: hypothetical protein WCD57_13170, partial [Acidobacteriaceae bacterium]